MPENDMSGSTCGRKRGVAAWPKLPRPFLDSTFRTDRDLLAGLRSHQLSEIPRKQAAARSVGFCQS